MISFKTKYFDSVYISVLHLIAKMNDVEILKLFLMKKGIDVNTKDSLGKKPIDYSENPEIKQLLSKEYKE